MVDMALPAVPNSAECEIVLNLSAARAIYNLATSTFRVRVADAPGGDVRYEWRTGGSADFPGSILSYDDSSGVLVLRAPSDDMRRCFPADLLRARRGQFVWEAQFALEAAPGNWIEIGDGPAAFLVKPGI